MEIITILILILMIILSASKKFSFAFVSLFSIMLMLLFNIIGFDEAFSGLASNTVLTYIGLSIMSSALVKNGILELICNYILKIVKTEKQFVFLQIIFSFLLSFFVSNKIVVLIFLQLFLKIDEITHGKLSKRNCALLAISTGLGGFMFVPSTSSLLTCDGLLKSAGYGGYNVFQFSLFSIVFLIAMLVYYLLINKDIKNVSIEREKIDENIKKDIPEKKKVILSISIFLVSILFFIFSDYKTGIISMACAVLCILLGCIEDKKAIKEVNWNVVILIACASGISQGIVNSGLSQLMASKFLSIISINTPKIILIALILLIIMIISNFITTVAVVTIFVPIGIGIANIFGIDVTLMSMIITIGACLTFITPMGNTKNALIIETCNLSVKDMAKSNFIFTLILYFLTVIIMCFLI